MTSFGDVESTFCVNKFVALVTFAGRNISNESRGEQRQNNIVFSCVVLIKRFNLCVYRTCRIAQRGLVSRCCGIFNNYSMRALDMRW